MYKNKRIGNLELRFNNIDTSLEIVKWRVNSFYETEDNYLKISEDMYYSEDGSYYIDSSCFQNPESCFSLCYMDKKNHDVIKILRDRIKELSPEEMIDFNILLLTLTCLIYNEEI